MSFSHNDLTGEVPVADVVRRRLYVEESFRFRIQKIDLSYNRLSGTINPVSAFLPSLRYLDFSGNQFSGQVRLPRLRWVVKAKSLTLIKTHSHFSSPVIMVGPALNI